MYLDIFRQTVNCDSSTRGRWYHLTFFLPVGIVSVLASNAYHSTGNDLPSMFGHMNLLLLVIPVLYSLRYVVTGVHVHINACLIE